MELRLPSRACARARGMLHVALVERPWSRADLTPSVGSSFAPTELPQPTGMCHHLTLYVVGETVGGRGRRKEGCGR